MPLCRHCCRFSAFSPGAGLDHIANPHRVDLLSAPLLLIVAWNLLVYLALHRLGPGPVEAHRLGGARPAAPP
jgi:hypothetical protein